MKRVLLLALLALIPVTPVLPAAGTGSIHVKVVGVQSEGGDIHFGLFDREEGFGDSDFTVAAGLYPVKDKRCEFIVTGLPFGEYAILLGHDVDRDGDISRNPFSRELKGASNYASKMWAWPDFERAKFVLDRKQLTVEIHLY